MGDRSLTSGPHRLVVEGDSVVHRSPPHVKLVAAVAFVSAVALTPRRAVWAFALDAAVLAAVAAAAKVPVAVVARRLLVVGPFLAAAVTVPFLADGPSVAVGPLVVSSEGLWAAWNIVAKALLGATASIVLTATTPIADVLAGLSRLRAPRPVVAIVAFMLRYLDLVGDEVHRVRLAMAARGHDPRWLWQARPMASAAGTLFVRTYERGERIHHAMLARGFTGRMPGPESRPAPATAWVAALAPAAVAIVATTAALGR